MKTAMQELKSDLVLTKETTKNSFLEIENQEIRKVCIEVVEITLNAIIKRIDTELLAMEKEQMKLACIRTEYEDVDKSDFQKAVEPAIRYLFNNYNPYTKIYINYSSAELLSEENCHNLNNEIPD